MITTTEYTEYTEKRTLLGRFGGDRLRMDYFGLTSTPLSNQQSIFLVLGRRILKLRLRPHI
ncbi:MAG TPA: hypothetical protein VM260_18705, partial [Pirellula sp.]|nr:hypothetical protein [Pirellula sp.]